MQSRADPAVIAALRKRIGAIAASGAESDGERTVPLGLPALDAALPWRGLPAGCLHEVMAGSPVEDEAAPAPGAAATGFAAVLLARFAAATAGYLLWCLRRDDLYLPGLASFGIDADRLIVVRARSRDDVLWVMEEALRCGRLAAVLGEVEAVDLTASRRLQLAAGTGGTAAFLLREGERRTAAGKTVTAAVTRWGVAPAPSVAAIGLGPPRWRLSLLRCRGGRPRDWLVEWDETARVLTLPHEAEESVPMPVRRAG